MYDFKAFDERASGIVTWLEKEYSGIRTGRATPALLDSVKVDSYGAKVPLNQVGSISIEDPRTLRVSLWDASGIQAAERAITEADFGVSVATDSSGLRVIFPELTSERRVQLLKIAKVKLEEARVSLRGARDEALKVADAQEKSGALTKDERYQIKDDLQKRIDAKNAELSAHYDAKEVEINQ